MQSDVNDTNTAASPEERGGDLRPMLEGPARPELRAVGGDARAGKAAEVSLRRVLTNRRCLLSAVMRKCAKGTGMSLYDPKRTSHWIVPKACLVIVFPNRTSVRLRTT
jgi:hypothetical protein